MNSCLIFGIIINVRGRFLQSRKVSHNVRQFIYFVIFLHHVFYWFSFFNKYWLLLIQKINHVMLWNVGYASCLYEIWCKCLETNQHKKLHHISALLHLLIAPFLSHLCYIKEENEGNMHILLNAVVHKLFQSTMFLIHLKV